MQSGDTFRSTVYTITYWWDSEGQARDVTLGNAVALWLGKNQNALNKKRAPEVIKLLEEQFPYVRETEVSHSQLLKARSRR